jgi:hypothetical protein
MERKSGGKPFPLKKDNKMNMLFQNDLTLGINGIPRYESRYCGFMIV